ncbi:MAG: ATP-binding protein [Treponemataceae bacterium]|nr:ATP-binding protein [Treponemataceae bacterium]
MFDSADFGEISEESRQLYESLPCGLALYDDSREGKLLFVNSQGCRFFGFDDWESLVQKGKPNLSDYVHIEDIPYVRKINRKMIAEGGQDKAEYRIIRADNTIRNVAADLSLSKCRDGSSFFTMSFVDITEEVLHPKEQAQTERLYKTLMENMPGGIVVLEYDRSRQKLHVRYCSEQVASLFGYSSDAILEKASDTPLDLVYHDDKALVNAAINNMVNFGTGIDLTFRILHADNELHYVSLHCLISENNDDKLEIYAIFTDADFQKKAEKNFYAQQKKINLLVEESDINFWEYDVTNNLATPQPRHMISTAYPIVYEDFPESFLKAGYVHPDSIENFRKLHTRIKRGARSAEAVIQFITGPDQTEWRRIKYVSLPDVNGNIHIAAGKSTDVTEQKEMERLFYAELAHQQSPGTQGLVSSLRANITRNIIGSVNNGAPTGIYSDLSFGGFIETVSRQIVDDDKRAEYVQLFSPDALLARYRAGDRYLSLEFRMREALGKTEIRWAETNLRLIEEPVSGDISAFMYLYDIDDKKTQEAVLLRMSTVNYDFLGIVDLESETYRSLWHKISEDNISVQTAAYSSEAVNIFMRLVPEEYKVPFREKSSLQTIKENLEHSSVYAFSFPVVLPDGTELQKKWQFLYLDDTKLQLIVYRNDITAIYQEEQRQKSNLRMALISANQANAAKTNFLSQMSHEIRTPMNAILGMTALASENINDVEYVKDCISKVELSANYLLSLINDILDMSRIESGKIAITNEITDFSKFLEGIYTIIQTQADQRGLIFQHEIDPSVQKFYLCDETKLQQILINLLGNSIKFTPVGGTVSLKIRQEWQENNSAMMIFEVSDTGIGISEETLPHIFDPFVQENTGFTSAYGGTGLGLAISRNLITLMGGVINVTSEKGKGSVFTIALKLKIAEDGTAEKSAVGITDDDVKILSGVNILFVGKSSFFRFAKPSPLERLGAKISKVSSVIEAAYKFHRKDRTLRHTLIVLDGTELTLGVLEQVKFIRSALGKECYLALAVDSPTNRKYQPAIIAGADFLVNTDSSCESFAEQVAELITMHSSVKKADSETGEKSEKEFDFTGKRFLLAEDHPLNIEVGKRLLQSRNASVDVAENGLIAINMFCSKPEHYYDAILMDIRMPEKDGITATKEIRALSRADAATIPIIAMTANAFDEDVAIAKNAGMNAHLAKPIEPMLLFRTLAHYIEEN